MHLIRSVRARKALPERIPSWLLATLCFARVRRSRRHTHTFTIASPGASHSLATELSATVDQLATAISSGQRFNPRIQLTRLRELIESVANLEETVEELEKSKLELACRAGEAHVAQLAAEGHASRERVLQNLANAARLSTLYSCARRAGLTTGVLNHEAIEYEGVLDAEATNNGRSLVDAIWDPAFRASIRARVDAEQL